MALIVRIYYQRQTTQLKGTNFFNYTITITVLIIDYIEHFQVNAFMA
jgi:hypothetical protein